MPIRITNTEPQQPEEPRIRAEDAIAALTRVGVDKTQTDINKYLKIYPVFESGLGVRF
jgi:hypothetical protein